MDVMGLRLRKSMVFAAICAIFIILALVWRFDFFFLALIAGAADIYYYHRGE